ncbi:MAG: hypothetical protein KDA84_08205, partial [Planctomycetaceae bacterium]|nr:hypothetical protein [Planctomycetaceae bacterium]
MIRSFRPGWQVLTGCWLLMNCLLSLGFADQKTEKRKPTRIDARSLHGKVLCGYQGWFRCPGDGSNEGWHHWSRDKRRLTPKSVSVEMWPDLSEFTEQEKYLVPGWSRAQSEPATLFSSVHPKTVQRHFEWMR